MCADPKSPPFGVAAIAGPLYFLARPPMTRAGDEPEDIGRYSRAVPAPVLALCRRLANAGYEAWVVGCSAAEWVRATNHRKIRARSGARIRIT